MKHNGWNPTRRNRNIRTAKQGYSQNNKLVIPDRLRDFHIFWERLKSPVIFTLPIKEHALTFFVEPARQGYLHACPPQDIITVLELIDPIHVAEIDLIVLRQPKRKEEILRPAWGRYAYFADLGRYSGPAIYLEAMQKNTILKWGKTLSPDRKQELEALKSDGHEIVQTKRGYHIHTTPDTVRNTQLFRTLAHEVGHAVDFLCHSKQPAVAAPTESESDYISNCYDAKPSLDKEEFAHRYSREFFEHWRKQGRLPFERKLDAESLQSLGLDPMWFGFEDQPIEIIGQTAA